MCNRLVHQRSTGWDKANDSIILHSSESAVTCTNLPWTAAVLGSSASAQSACRTNHNDMKKTSPVKTSHRISDLPGDDVQCAVCS